MLSASLAGVSTFAPTALVPSSIIYSYRTGTRRCNPTVRSLPLPILYVHHLSVGERKDGLNFGAGHGQEEATSAATEMMGHQLTMSPMIQLAVYPGPQRPPFLLLHPSPRRRIGPTFLKRMWISNVKTVSSGNSLTTILQACRSRLPLQHLSLAYLSQLYKPLSDTLQQLYKSRSITLPSYACTFRSHIRILHVKLSNVAYKLSVINRG
jgi:hypothetical protein